MKKKIPKKNSIDGVNLPDSRLVELLDRCIISVRDIKSQKKEKKTKWNRKIRRKDSLHKQIN